MPNAKLIAMTPEPMKLLKAAASMCYQKKATDKVIDHIIKNGHWSVLEHCSASFEVTCSIVVLMQLTRHRHLSFTCQSSRYSALDGTYNTGYLEVDSMTAEQLDSYKDLLSDTKVPGEYCAYVIPKAANYKLVVTGNFRAWMEYLPKRLCKRASKEHRELASLIYKELLKACPGVFKNLKMSCGTCEEKGCEHAKH